MVFSITGWSRMMGMKLSRPHAAGRERQLMAARVNSIQGVADHAGPHEYWNFERPTLRSSMVGLLVADDASHSM